LRKISTAEKKFIWNCPQRVLKEAQSCTYFNKVQNSCWAKRRHFFLQKTHFFAKTRCWGKNLWTPLDTRVMHLFVIISQNCASFKTLCRRFQRIIFSTIIRAALLFWSIKFLYFHLNFYILSPNSWEDRLYLSTGAHNSTPTW
jgi:hypothetical protein